ncbi:MAG: hypothetical protein ABI990_12880, partial [Actinomycetota bacterium]
MEIGVPLAPAARRGGLALDRVLAWRLALGGLVVVSIAARTLAAWLRATPNYFPDEYIYTSLSRSIAAGGVPSVRGHAASFPALLQPLLTAPAWLFGSLETGYRVTQLIESVAMSTTALLVWWLARRLGVARPAAFLAAALSLAAPDLTYTGWMLAEPFAYPLFVAAIATGTMALARPSRRTQLLFLGAVALAVLARMQLAVLPIAYVAAAVLLGRRALREQRIVLGAFGLGIVVALLGGLGYYQHAPAGFSLPGLDTLASLGRNLLVLAYAAGWIVVPAALLGLVAALTRSRTREEKAFGAFAVCAALLVIAEAALYGELDVVHERYAAYVLPLLALGFALHADRGWRWRRTHAAIAALMFLVSAAVPLAGWAAAGKNAHSIFLTAVVKVEALAGTAGAGSLIVAAAAAALALVAVVVAFRPRLATAVVGGLAIAACLVSGTFAISFDVQNSRNVSANFLPSGPGWVDHTHVGRATLVAGPFASRTSLLEQLFWNRSVRAIALLPETGPPDVFDAQPTKVDARGTLVGVRGPVVLDEDGTALVAREPVRTSGTYVLARTPVLDAAVNGRFGDGWLAQVGTVRSFGPGVLSFTLLAPEAMTFTLNGHVLHLRAHQALPVRLRACGASTALYTFSSHGFVGLRMVSARGTFPVWHADAKAPACKV